MSEPTLEYTAWEVASGNDWVVSGMSNKLGEVNQARFYGPNAKKRAEQYIDLLVNDGSGRRISKDVHNKWIKKRSTSMNEHNGPFEQFCDELDELIDRWRDKPEDDQLSRAEVIGALQFKSLQLALEAKG